MWPFSIARGRALAEQMQISRPTLREAVKVLQDSGLHIGPIPLDGPNICGMA